MNSKLINLALLLGSALLLSACGGTSTSRSSGTSSTYHRAEPIITPSPTPNPVGTEAVFTRRFNYSPGSRNGHTLHAIIVAATNDGSIGKSVKVDLTNMVRLVREIAEETGMSLTGGSISGGEFTRDNVLGQINNLSVGRNDVVLFYNASHGLNSGGNSDWPAIYFSRNESELPLEEVAAMLKNKNPRLSMVLGDLCNNVYSRSVFATARTERGKQRNYQTLFLNYAGDILASGSKKGQSSWGNPQVGGLFTYTFLNELDQELMEKGIPSWEALMGRVTDEPIPEAKKPQQPQARVNVRLVGEPPQPPDCQRNPDHKDCKDVDSDPRLSEPPPNPPKFSNPF